MVRNLTQDEINVLAHSVVDPEVWWAHAQEYNATQGQAEVTLLNKINRLRPEYDLVKDNPEYQTRKEFEDAKAATMAAYVPSYRVRRAKEYTEMLGEDNDQINTIGDCLDVILKEIKSWRDNGLQLDSNGNLELSDKMNGMLNTIAAIKAAYPKPG